MWKRIGAAVLFLAVCAGAFALLTDILRQKWVRNGSAAQQIVQGYYEEPDHSLDVLFLGSSSIRSGVSPLEMFHQYGFTAYSRATSAQLPVISYYLLQETLASHDIKAVVMDVTPLMSTLLNGYSWEDVIGKIHEAVDYMPRTEYRRKLIQEILETEVPVQAADFLLPLFVYHDRWQEINADDFTYRSRQAEYCYKGQNPEIRTTAVAFDEKHMTPADDGSENVRIEPEYARDYQRIIALCKNQGIELVLVKMPGISWSLDHHDLIQAFADASGVPFIDFNEPELLKQTGFDARTDFLDTGAHLNVTGANKISGYLGQYLAERIRFEDKRQDAAFASWHGDYEKYGKIVTDTKLDRETNLIAVLRALQNPDYIAMIATRNNVSRFFTQDVADALAELGIDAPFASNPYLSYAGIISNGRAVCQDVDETPDDREAGAACSAAVGGHSISVSSCSARANNAVFFQLDGQSIKNIGMGFNIVVYDQAIHRVVLQKAFNTGLRGKAYRQPAPSVGGPFDAIKNDPVACLEEMKKADYISFIGVAYSSGRQIPGAVNDQLTEMGLLPLDGGGYKSYLAVFSGSQVLYNQLGKARSEVSFTNQVDGLDVAGISNTNKTGHHSLFTVNGESVRETKAGLILSAYSKKEKRFVFSCCYDWSVNYVSDTDYASLTAPDEIIAAARDAGDDIICLYAGVSGAARPPRALVSALRNAGLEGFGQDGCWAAVLHGDGSVGKTTGEKEAILKVESHRGPYQLTAGETGTVAAFRYVQYTNQKPEAVLIIYHPEADAILSLTAYGLAEEETGTD